MNFVYRHLIPWMWGIWVFYWIVSARNLKPAVRRESTLSRLKYNGFLLIALALWLWPPLTGSFLFKTFLRRSEFTFWTGAFLVFAGLSFAIWARRILGRNWSGTVTIKREHELIQSGPYQWVRHPIYTGLLLAFLGSALVLAEWRGLLACVLLFLSLLLKSRKEEHWMIETFGETYRDYRKRVCRLIPLIW